MYPYTDVIKISTIVIRDFQPMPPWMLRNVLRGWTGWISAEEKWKVKLAQNLHPGELSVFF